MKIKICVTDFCRNTAKSGRYCYKCQSARRRAKDPIKAAYWTLRSHAKERDIEFLLTFEQFKYFAQKVDLIGNRGRAKESWHVDRVDDNGPYAIWNIQVLTNEQNAHKEQARRAARKNLYYDWQTKSGYWVYRPPEFVIDSDCPF